jgi:hypothetical protein
MTFTIEMDVYTRHTTICVVGNGTVRVKYLETPSDVVDGNEALPVLIDDLEPFDVCLDLVLAEVNRNLVTARAVYHLAHLIC